MEKCRAKHAYIGIFAEQLINGVSIIVMRSRSDASVRVAIIAGTVHPNPISMGTKLRPDRPNLRSGLSIIKATRAMYPVSSSIERKKNSVTIIGKKLSTLPTPANMPSIIRLRTTSFMPYVTSALSHSCVSFRCRAT